jgi:hypothetical protein
MDLNTLLEWVCQKCGNLLWGFDICVGERASALPLGGGLMVYSVRMRGFFLCSEDYSNYSGMRLSKGVGFPELQREKTRVITCCKLFSLV